MPFVTIGAIAAGAGLLGAGGAGAAGVGKNTYRASNFDQAAGYDPNRYYYGGSPRGATDASADYLQQARDAQYRAPAQGNYGGLMPNYATATRFQNYGTQDRNAQNQAAGLMMARAQGRVPSIAQMQADRQMQQAISAQGAQQASARGAAGLALAQQNAANNIANAHADISGQAQVNAANERMQAEQNAFGAYSGLRGNDLNSQQQAASQQQFSANLGTQQVQNNAQLAFNQAQLNDAMTQNMTRNSIDVNNAQLNANVQQQSLLASGHQAANAQNAQINQNNANNEWKPFQMAVGAVQGGGQMATTGLKPAADGGPVNKGDTVLVGEHGPEVIKMVGNGLVIPHKGDQPPILWGTDGRAYANTGEGLAPLTPKPRTMQEFRRDTPEDQARVASAYRAGLMREADAQMAGYQRQLAQGPTTPREMGEAEAPPAWLADYMAQQQAQDAALARMRRLTPEERQRALLGSGMMPAETRPTPAVVPSGGGLMPAQGA